MLSVVIPAYNEREPLPVILGRVIQALPHVAKEIVIVDDCSTDGTRGWLIETIGETARQATLDVAGRFVIASSGTPGQNPLVQVRALFHAANQGKGAALRTGLRACSGPSWSFRTLIWSTIPPIGTASGPYSSTTQPTWCMAPAFYLLSHTAASTTPLPGKQADILAI